MSVSDTLRRTVAPRLLVKASRVEWPAQLSARLRRALGKPAHIELYFAFDDPYAAIAMPGLIKIARKHKAKITLYPLVERGIPDDPAVDKRRVHAVEDSQRLARRSGKTLSRTTPLRPSHCAFLAEWTESARHDEGMLNFASAALEHLWFRSSGPVKQDELRNLHTRTLHSAAAGHNAAALARNTARLLKLGHWESPAALVEGQWFLAHERLAQIDEHLERLGW